jgi:hypothetical protein
MRYAQLINGKIVATQSGAEPAGSGWVEIKNQWAIPTDYPSNFYSPTSNVPRLTEVGDEVHETWGFTLKPVETIKDSIYKDQKYTRQQMQLGSFLVGDLSITLKDREDSLIISSLPEADTRYKVAQGHWITLSAAEVKTLKEAHRTHVQYAYDWEMNSNFEVDALFTHEDLVVYLTPPEVS